MVEKTASDASLMQRAGGVPFTREALWAGRLPHAFVICALAALTVIPTVVKRRIAVARDEILAVADPARMLVADLQLELARMLVALRTDPERLDSAQRAQIRAATIEQERLLAFFERSSARLGPDVVRANVALREAFDAWQVHVAQLIVAGGSAEFEAALYFRPVAAAAQLERAVSAATQARFFEMRQLERREGRLMAAAVLLALVAALVVAWLGRRLRLTAEVAARRRVEVESLMESKRRLMDGITHDIKNPLNAIDGYAQLLQGGMKGELTPPQRESIVRIRRNVRSTLAIINDLLEIARAETGQLQIDRDAVDVVQLTREALEDHLAELEAHGMSARFETELPEAVIDTDADRIRAILGNLLSNAGKYSPSGGTVVTICALRESDAADSKGKWLTVAVQDDGPGIPPDQREFVFEEFARLEKGTRRGAGLGLAISRKIARLMGGDLTVEAGPAGGSVFTLWLRPNKAGVSTTVATDPAMAGDPG